MMELGEARTGRTCIRLLREDDGRRLLDYRVANRGHLAPWEPLRAPAHFTLAGCHASIASAIVAAREDRGYAFAVLDPEGRRMLASFNLNNVVRGVLQAAHLGYGVDAGQQGSGLMFEALQAGLALAFGPLGLHRVMANHMPRNERSARLLARLGFEREGYARSYLCIAGQWEDHVLTAMLADDFKP
ncbi:MAG TPA: GNAT family N-acetyltransferase [Rhodanobacteraceae bacterium]|nr:GNAT family N-acetyltransferase [Rhodanobacteraceae bacterium]